MTQSKKIVCIHLLNDFSGSPLVLSQVIQSFVKEGYAIDLYTSKNSSEGFLSNLKGVSEFRFFYRWSRFKLFTLVFFFWSQFLLFFKLLKYRKQDVVFYVNTVLPFGAALAGKLMSKKVIFHVHESSIQPAVFKKFLFNMAAYTANDAIFVSDYLRKKESIPNVNCHTIYNAITEDFLAAIPTIRQPKTVLMLCSLKDYKGVREFVELAEMMPKESFELVLNANETQINHFFKNSRLPNNLKWHPSQNNVHLFYSRAKIVLNLSHPDKWVETFGMTALEAMSYSIPVIVPPVGGIAEVVTNNTNGYTISVDHLNAIKNQIASLNNDPSLYHKVAAQALKRAREFSIVHLHQAVLKVLNEA